MDIHLATVINFSTNEAPFLSHCLEEVAHFSDQVLVCVSDHFFDGSQEDRQLLNAIYHAHPKTQFIEYAWSKEHFYGQHSAHFWHNTSRLLGFYFLETAITAVLFLDVDEIVEGSRFAKWLNEISFEDTCAFRLACYWYFREAKWRAKELEASPLLIQREVLDYDLLLHPYERGGMFHQVGGEDYVSKDKPFVHHYSWVRSKGALLKKATSWGHRNERDWVKLIEEEFSHSFSGTDFVHGYNFTEVEPYLKPIEYRLKTGSAPNVIYLSMQDMHAIDLKLKFGIEKLHKKTSVNLFRQK